MVGSILTHGSVCGRSWVVKDWETLWFSSIKEILLFHSKCLWYTQYTFILSSRFILLWMFLGEKQNTLCCLIQRWQEMWLLCASSYWPPGANFSHDPRCFSLFSSKSILLHWNYSIYAPAATYSPFLALYKVTPLLFSSCFYTGSKHSRRFQK